jgi:hypothetical protein
MAAPITTLFHAIHKVTGFANGEQFETAEQVQDYFTIANLHEMFGQAQFLDADGRDLTPSQATLDEWAETIIEKRWHCAEDFTA